MNNYDTIAKEQLHREDFTMHRDRRLERNKDLRSQEVLCLKKDGPEILRNNLWHQMREFIWTNQPTTVANIFSIAAANQKNMMDDSRTARTKFYREISNMMLTGFISFNDIYEKDPSILPDDVTQKEKDSIYHTEILCFNDHVSHIAYKATGKAFKLPFTSCRTLTNKMIYRMITRMYEAGKFALRILLVPFSTDPDHLEKARQTIHWQIGGFLRSLAMADIDNLCQIAEIDNVYTVNKGGAIYARYHDPRFKYREMSAALAASFYYQKGLHVEPLWKPGKCKLHEFAPSIIERTLADSMTSLYMNFNPSYFTNGSLSMVRYDEAIR